MRVLVTGGHGFVGRHLAVELATAGHAVEARDIDTLDVTDGDAVLLALRARADAIVHLAAVAHPRAASADPGLAFRVAIAGTTNLLEAVRAASPDAFVLVVGSAEVYGHPDPGDLPLQETAPLRPTTAYAQTKVAQEALALAYRERYGLRVAVARPFNHSGRGQSPEFVLPALAGRVLDVASGRSDGVRVGNLDVARDFLHVGDVVRAYRLLVENAARDASVEGRVFNIASGRAVSIRELLAELCRVAGVSPNLIDDPELARPGEPGEVRGDASLLTSATGWRPQASVTDLVTDLLGASPPWAPGAHGPVG